MEDIITDIQREVVFNTANINQLRLDLDDVETYVTNILSLMNDITSKVVNIERQLQHSQERIDS